MEEISIGELNSYNIEWLDIDALPSIIKRDTLFAYFKSESGRYYKWDAFDALSSYASLSHYIIIEENIIDELSSYYSEGRIDKIARFV
jgi:hypothetical protein